MFAANVIAIFTHIALIALNVIFLKFTNFLPHPSLSLKEKIIRLEGF